MIRPWLLLCLLSALPLAACSRQSDRDPCGQERVVDPILLAFLSQARSAHHLADSHEAAGDMAGAVRSLQTITEHPPATQAPEIDEVLADTRARLADLLSRSGRFDPAIQEITEGLKHAKAQNYFRGHLYEVQGLVEERREKALRSTGRGQEADQARERSLSAYEEALKIQAEVIQSAAPAPSVHRP